MRCLVAIEGRFTLHDGAPASRHLSYRRFWYRYREVFEQVVIVARLVEKEDRQAQCAVGPGVEFIPLPPYVGLAQYLRHTRQIYRTLLPLVEPGTAYILRVPGTVATSLWHCLRKRDLPYGVEVVSDPARLFQQGGVRHPFEFVLNRCLPYILRHQCANAAAAAYVTQSDLQRSYPPASAAFRTTYSSVELDSEAIADYPRDYGRARSSMGLHLVGIGSLDQTYKGLGDLLRALRMAHDRHLEWKLTWVGDGRLRSMYERQVHGLGLTQHVSFTGQLAAGPSVREVLDSADIFVCPSRVEGLPRALLEAMARGLVCVATKVGGIPEILSSLAIVEPGNPAMLFERLQLISGSSVIMALEAKNNLLRAYDFRTEVLSLRRRSMYRQLRALSELS